MSGTPLALFAWAESQPVAGPRAPEGIKRAARAGGAVDFEIIAWARRHVGMETAIPEAHAEVKAKVQHLEDTFRRRLQALKAMGFLTLGRPSRTGHVIVTWVSP